MKRITVGVLSFAIVATAAQNQRNAPPNGDAVQEAQTQRAVNSNRPEQKKSDQDKAERFAATNAQPISPVLKSQPEEGKIKGFDFFRDPLNAKKPME